MPIWSGQPPGFCFLNWQSHFVSAEPWPLGFRQLHGNKVTRRKLPQPDCSVSCSQETMFVNYRCSFLRIVVSIGKLHNIRCFGRF